MIARFYQPERSSVANKTAKAFFNVLGEGDWKKGVTRAQNMIRALMNSTTAADLAVTQALAKREALLKRLKHVETELANARRAQRVQRLAKKRKRPATHPTKHAESAAKRATPAAKPAATPAL